MTIPLSILDVSPIPSGANSIQALRNTIDLARFADRLGYTRYWLAEHHNSAGIASTSPDIMIGQIAQQTQRIRVGSGGVMLPNHAPLKVVESFRLLEALFPNRIDLGIGRAPGTDAMTALALRRSHEKLTAEDFPQEFAELQAFATDNFPENHPFQKVKASPVDVPLPPVWLLGSSGFSSQMSAQLGLGFSFAHHIGGDIAVPAMLQYRQHFRPSETFSKPHAILAASVICADTDEEAYHLALSVGFMFLSLQLGIRGLLSSPEEVLNYPLKPHERDMLAQLITRHIVGSPTTVKAQLDQLITDTQADEVMVLTIVHDHEARRYSYELLSQLYQLPVIER